MITYALFIPGHVPCGIGRPGFRRKRCPYGLCVGFVGLRGEGRKAVSVQVFPPGTRLWTALSDRVRTVFFCWKKGESSIKQMSISANLRAEVHNNQHFTQFAPIT